MTQGTPRRCETWGHHQQNELECLCEELRATPEMQAKKIISLAAPVPACANLTLEQRYAMPGDDCAALRCGDGYQLLAMEGMLPAFVERDPRAAGWSAVMVNISDIAAMGGRATAIVNAYWDNNTDHAAQLLLHMRRACDVFGVHFAGGHSSIDNSYPAGLAVAITGYAGPRLLSCHHLRPGQRLFLLTDLDGSWHGDLPYWGCVLGKSNERLRAQWQVPAELAERGLAVAAKDISNGGLLGTLVMMLELTGCGAKVDLNAIPRPDADLPRWLRAFQSFGFLLAVEAGQTRALLNFFDHSPLSCAPIGSIDDSGVLAVDSSGVTAVFWDLNSECLTNMGEAHASGQL